MYRVFYCFYGEPAEVPWSQPVPIVHADIYSDLFGRLQQDGDFLGVVDQMGRTLQIMYNADRDRYWVEIPAPERRGGYGRYMTFDEATDLLKKLPETFVPDAVPSLAFTAW